MPSDAIFIRSKAFVLNDKAPALADNPDVVLPVNTNDGNALVPADNCRVPVIVSPDLSTLFEALPVKLAVIVPAVKFPEASRATIVLAVFAAVASTLKVMSSVLVVIVVCVLAINDRKFNVLLVLFLKTSPVPAPIFAPVVKSGKLKREKTIGSVPITADGVLHNQLEPAYTAPDNISTYACPAKLPVLKSVGRVHAPD